MTGLKRGNIYEIQVCFCPLSVRDGDDDGTDLHHDGGHISAQILKCDKARTPRAKGMGKDAHDRARRTAQRRQISKDAPKFLWWP